MAGSTWAQLAAAPARKLLEQFLHAPRLARAPIVLYRAGLGWVLGSRMLMLEHVGRKSGQRRYVVLEVIGHPQPGAYLVASGFGEAAQWYQNVMAEPRVHISTGRRRSVPAHARRLSDAEADSALQAYIAAHPRAWEALKGVMEHSLGGRLEPPGTELPLVELTVSAP